MLWTLMSRYVLSISYGINLVLVFNCYYIFITVTIFNSFNCLYRKSYFRLQCNKKLVLISQARYRHWITKVFLFSFSLTNCSLSPLLNFVTLLSIFYYRRWPHLEKAKLPQQICEVYLSKSNKNVCTYKCVSVPQN